MCFCNCIRKSLTKVALSHMVMVALGIMTLFLADVGLAFAQSPVVTVANYDLNNRCINWIHGTYDVDTFTRDALPGEVYTSWHPEALRANAVLIRSVAYYHTIDPQWDDGFPFCNGILPQFYNIHTARIQGWQGGRGAVMGNVNNRTNDRVTDTGGRVLLQNNQAIRLNFNRCLQNYSNDLANQGRDYTYILTDPRYGVYGTDQQCISPLSNLSINPRYTFVSSMTNGTAPISLPGGQQTSEVTPVLTPRQAERYWGFAHLDLVQANPFDQPGTYVVGLHKGDKAEYRLYFGGSYPNLHLVGIADRPGPVTMNIYIDGYYRGQMNWSNNDNQRHLTIGSFSGVSYGVHAICIEFQNDYWQYPPGGDEYDRNFYLDVLGVAN